MTMRKCSGWLMAVAMWLIFCAAQVAFPQSAPRRAFLALSKSNHTLAIVDPATLHVVARVPLGPDPHEVIASSDGSIYGGGR